MQFLKLLMLAGRQAGKAAHQGKAGWLSGQARPANRADGNK